jgi:hypothetical protein
LLRFFQVGLDAMLGNNEPQEHASRNTEDTFLGIELDVFLFEALKRNVEVINQVVDPLGFDHDVVNVGLDGWPNVFSKNVLHASLVRSPCVPETEGHSNVAIHAKRGDE